MAWASQGAALCLGGGWGVYGECAKVSGRVFAVSLTLRLRKTEGRQVSFWVAAVCVEFRCVGWGHACACVCVYMYRCVRALCV